MYSAMYRWIPFLILILTIMSTLGNSAVFAMKKKKKGGKKKNRAQVTEFRSMNGHGNNSEYPNWGEAHTVLTRQAETSYTDGKNEAINTRPNSRTISNNIFAQDQLFTNDRALTDIVWQWGQFLDHDIDLSPGASPSEAFNISIPQGDLEFDPQSTGTKYLSLNRSAYELDDNGTRQQLNEITAYIDASNVYGLDDTRAAALRTFSGGQLKTSAGNLLPFNTDRLANEMSTSPSFFLAGDVRANEQIGLTAMHTLFVREHNRYAKELAIEKPEYSDEELYQTSRAFVAGLMQEITYKEFIPALLGKKALKPYKGYKENTNASIMNEFSTAAFRFGHSMISPTILRLDNNGDFLDQVSLRDAFFRRDFITQENDIAYILNGLANTYMQEVDANVIDDLRNFLFGAPGSGGLDIVSLNIQRGRDHGLADYNSTREAFGLKPKRHFLEITRNIDLARRLQNTYSDINQVDLWVGALCEEHLPGKSVGETMYKILKTQFEVLRDGDRFWYERYLTASMIKELKQTYLSDVILRNTNIKNLRKNIFIL